MLQEFQLKIAPWMAALHFEIVFKVGGHPQSTFLFAFSLDVTDLFDLYNIFKIDPEQNGLSFWFVFRDLTQGHKISNRQGWRVIL